MSTLTELIALHDKAKEELEAATIVFEEADKVNRKARKALQESEEADELTDPIRKTRSEKTKELYRQYSETWVARRFAMDAYMDASFRWMLSASGK